MTRAASLLNVAQPALGLQIRQLEDVLGTPLLERHSRGVSSTPAGQLLYKHAVAILAMFDTAEREVRALNQSGRESLTLGVTHSIMRLVGRDLIQAAKRDLPDVHVSLVEQPSMILIRELEAGEIDIALTYDVPETPGIDRTPMQSEELLFVARAGTLPAGETIGVREVLSYELVMAGERDPIRRMVDAAASLLGLPVKATYEVQSLMATRQVLLDALAGSVLPYGVVADELRDGVIESRRIEKAPFKRTLYIARSSRRGAFANEESILRLLRSVTKQLALDLADLASPAEEVPSDSRSG